MNPQIQTVDGTIHACVVGIGKIGKVQLCALLEAKKNGLDVDVSLCSERLDCRDGHWARHPKNNLWPEVPEKPDLSAVCNRFMLFEGVIADPTVHLVVLCKTNGHHRPMAIKAMRAGKHVLVEKPITLLPADAEEMIRVADECGVNLMVSHVLPFFPAWAKAREIIKSGEHGALKWLELTRRIPSDDPTNDPAQLSETGSSDIDLHIHCSHYATDLLGQPLTVSSVANVSDTTFVHQVSSHYRYSEDDDGPIVRTVSGALSGPGLGFSHSLHAVMESGATLMHSATYLDGVDAQEMPLILVANGKASKVNCAQGAAFEAFQLINTHATDVCRGRTEQGVLSARLATDALQLCLRERKSAVNRTQQ